MQVNKLVLAFLGFLCCTATAFLEYKEAASDHAATFSPKQVRKSFPKRQSTFDAASQEVSTTGEYAWEAPNFAKGDQRGPCPGLNALANHGYLPRNGVSDVTTMVNAVNTAYGMGLDFGNFLAAYGSVFDGDLVSLSFSIGGASSALTSGLFGTPAGLSGSHNNYEADTSPTRGDYYVVKGSDQLQLPFFEEYYNALSDNVPAAEQYANLFKFRQSRFNYSIETNPYFFHPVFAGVAVSPAGFAFPVRMMANHSAEYPEGYLDKNTFKSFFGVTGSPGSFKHQRGWERIPNNWYRRPLSAPYTIVNFVADIAIFGLQDPRLIVPGGNTGANNTYIGLSVSDITNGAYTLETLVEGDSLECFIFQAVQGFVPSFVQGLTADATAALGGLTSSVTQILSGLECPQLEKPVDMSGYKNYPGFNAKTGGAKV